MRSLTYDSPQARSGEPRPTTLLSLIRTLGEVTDDDREVVATALHMLRSGEVKLCGILREVPVDELG